MLEEGVGPTQGDENEAIVRGTESVTIEILPKVAYCFRAVVVCGAHGEAAPYLTGKFVVVSA